MAAPRSPETSRRLRRLLAALALAPVLPALSCGSPPVETQLLMDFFHASRLADHTVLASVATISLNPRTEGAVQHFEVVSMGSEQRRALRSGAERIGAGDNAAFAVQSLTPRGEPDVNIDSMDVTMIVKPVTVQAQVRTPDGRTASRTLVFTLARASATRGTNALDGRWFITGLQQR